MNNYRVVITPAGVRDLQQIYRYIAETHGAYATAEQVTARLRERMLGLETMPCRIPLARDPHLAARGVRLLPAGKYLVFFQVEEAAGAVYILRVLGARQDWLALLGGRR